MSNNLNQGAIRRERILMGLSVAGAIIFLIALWGPMILTMWLDALGRNHAC